MSYAEDVIRLAGDIGGTNTRLAMFGKDFEVLHRKTYHNDHGTLAEHVRQFLVEAQRVPAAACLGVAGPVKNGQVTLTNRNWTISEEELADEIGLTGRKVKLINDMVAHAASLECRFAQPLEIIREGKPAEQGTQLLVMPGTGLGVGILQRLPDADHAWPVPSEGGHVDFAPRPGEESLLKSLREQVGDRVSWEHLLSGPGLGRIHKALTGEKAEPEAAIRHQETAETFINLLGRYCGNMAFATLATGGVVLGGSIVATLLPQLRSERLVDAFNSVGPEPLADEIRTMPIRVMTGETGLLGAATYASWLLANPA